MRLSAAIAAFALARSRGRRGKTTPEARAVRDVAERADTTKGLVVLYTDGSCADQKDPNAVTTSAVVCPSEGWGFSTLSHPAAKNSGGAELYALLLALRFVRTAIESRVSPPAPFLIVCDCKYAVDVVKVFTPIWARNGWRKAGSDDPPKFLELVKEIHELWTIGGMAAHVDIFHCPGHSNVRGNEAADTMATAARLQSHGARFFVGLGGESASAEEKFGHLVWDAAEDRSAPRATRAVRSCAPAPPAASLAADPGALEERP